MGPCKKNAPPCLRVTVSATKKEEFGKYRAFKMRDRRSSGLVVILQACLARRAKLKLSISRNPIPPSDFGRHRRAHDIHEMPLELFEPHQYLLMIFSTSSKMVLGSLKHDITYVGIACKTDFINTSLPACDKFFSFQPFTRLHNLSLR